MPHKSLLLNAKYIPKCRYNSHLRLLTQSFSNRRDCTGNLIVQNQLLMKKTIDFLRPRGFFLLVFFVLRPCIATPIMMERKTTKDPNALIGSLRNASRW